MKKMERNTQITYKNTNVSWAKEINFSKVLQAITFKLKITCKAGFATQTDTDTHSMGCSDIRTQPEKQGFFFFICSCLLT